MKFKYKLLLVCSLFMLSNNKILLAKETSHHHHHEKIESLKATSNSIYQINSKWKNQDNKDVKLQDFKDKPVVLTMLYTSCTKSCPIIIGYLKTFYESLSNEDKDKVNFVVISFDSKRDNPEKLKKFSEKNNLISNFTFLNGSDDNILEIASLLGIKYIKTDDEEFSHTNKIIFLNKKGEIYYQNEGLSEDIEESKKILKKIF
ncbi:MAG: SCO family protein [Candidatus Sericytochromatia bacterium]